MRFTNEAKLMIFCLAISFLAGGFLAWTENKEIRLARTAGFSVLYFDNPKDNTLNFTVENHYPGPMEYTWEIKGAMGGEKGSFVLDSLAKKTQSVTGVSKGEVRVTNQTETLLIKKN